MDRVGMGGLSLQGATVAELERLRGSEEGGEEEFLRELADALAASEVVHLATCNRTEIIFAREAGHPPSAEDLTLVAQALGATGEIRDRLHLVTGRAAVMHLFRVTSSLESVVQGEDQILAQVRAAYARSHALGLTGPLLDPLFESAFQIGKQVRAETELSRHPVSVMSVGVQLLTRALAEIRPAGAKPARLALIGAGVSARLAAQAARDHGLDVAFIANRTLARAHALAAEFDAGVSSIDELVHGAGVFDALISTTGAPGYVLDRQQLQCLARRSASAHPLVALDLAVPRDLEPGAGPDVEIIDLDDVNASAEHNKSLRAEAARAAEVLIERKLEAFERRSLQKRLASVIAEQVGESNEFFERQLAELHALARGGGLGELGPEELVAVERWARTTFGRMTHRSLSACKEFVHQGSSERASTSDVEGETTG